MIVRIKLTKEHLKLIPFFYEQEEGDNKIVFDKTHLYNIGSHLLEDLAMIIGYNDSAIKGTEEDADGKAFPDDIESHLLEVHNYIVDNFFYIESLIHYYVTIGGLTEGEYKCKDNELVWQKV